jgi:hypothetical protein
MRLISTILLASSLVVAACSPTIEPRYAAISAADEEYCQREARIVQNTLIFAQDGRPEQEAMEVVVQNTYQNESIMKLYMDYVTLVYDNIELDPDLLYAAVLNACRRERVIT